LALVVAFGSRVVYRNNPRECFYVGYISYHNDCFLFYNALAQRALNTSKGIYMSDTIESVLDRIKNLKVFDVEVDIPEGFFFSGVIPFDATISQNKGVFKVYASTQEEANERVNSYLTRNTQE
jgi:hypothetical protein